MAALDDYEELATATSQLSDETAVELVELLRTAMSNESLATALSSLSDDQLSTLTARENLWDDSAEDDDMSTCLSATASQYSLPEEETNVEMPVILDSGVVIVDSLECLARLDTYQPVPADVGFEFSHYEMPPSETNVTIAEAKSRLFR